MSHYRFETLQIHAGQEVNTTQTGAQVTPIYQTASYVFPDCQHAADRFALKEAGNIYGRLTNPTQQVFEERMAALEGGSGSVAVASGAAAVAYAIQNIAGVGDHIVAAQTLYGGTFNLLSQTLPQSGITTTFVDIFDEVAVEEAIKEHTKAIFIETLTNPHSQVVDIEAIAQIAHRHHILLIVDNTFATPYLVKPIVYGADIVVHSATKYIGGHGATLGGVVIEGGHFNFEASNKYPGLTNPNQSYGGLSFYKACGKVAFVTRLRAVLLRDLGATLSPFHAFLLIQGLETLSLRIDRHLENTRQVIAYLQQQGAVAQVNHPSVSEDKKQRELYAKYFPNGGGSIFTLNLKGTEKDAIQFIDKLKLFSLVANVADVKSLVIHPATTTHAQLSEEALVAQQIKPCTIRLSIGTENIQDILEDLEQAFQ